MVLPRQSLQLDAVFVFRPRVAQTDDVVVDVGGGDSAQQQVHHLLRAIIVGAHESGSRIVKVLADSDMNSGESM